MSGRRGRREEKDRELWDALGRPGSDLLSRVLRQSTIGAEGVHGRVRNGIGLGPLARTTRPAKSIRERMYEAYPSTIVRRWTLNNESNQADRVISTGKLNTLLCLHTRPIDVVVYHDSHARSCFEVGFPLRCLQRLSRPYIATLHCRWHDNRSTSGTSIPVLSY